MIIDDVDDGIYLYNYFEDSHSAKLYADWKTIPDSYIIDRYNVQKALPEIINDLLDGYDYSLSIDIDFNNYADSITNQLKGKVSQKIIQKLINYCDEALSLAFLEKK